LTKLSPGHKLISRNSKKPTEKLMTANLIIIFVFVLLLAVFYRALTSRAYWKRRASRNGGVSLVCYQLSAGETESHRQIILKHFPDKLTVALENAHEFLDRNGFKPINSASRARVFAKENERVKMFFLSDGIVSETML